MTLNDLTSFDCIIGLILVMFLLRGLCAGFIRQAASIAALAGSYWLAGEHVGKVMPYAQDLAARPGAVFLLSFGCLLFIFMLLFAMLGHLLQRVLEIKLLGWTNRFAGGLLGLGRGVLVAALLHMILASAFSPSHHLFQNSLAAPYLSKGAEVLRQFIRDAKVREDLKPNVPLSDPQDAKNGGEEVPTAEKVRSVTIPDQEAVPSAPEQKGNSSKEEKVIIPAEN
ncbi:CvpA family protein [Candidatus Electronema sp. TJ]|uniref:CvpA family protein n=1 Tax=Candidatus Electronema sp. TJ TaxID=3401573 RepID=UPI003AA94D90